MSVLCGAEHPEHEGVTCSKPAHLCFLNHTARRGPDSFVWDNPRRPPEARADRPKANEVKSRATGGSTSAGDPSEVWKKNDGMDAALAMTPEQFKKAFYDAATEVALTQGSFTSDDIWLVLERKGVDTENRAGVGPLMAAFAAQGNSEKSGQHAVSTRPNSKARDGLTVWTSLIYRGPRGATA